MGKRCCSEHIVAATHEVCSWPILLKKSEYRLVPIFSAPWARFSDADAGGLVIRLRLNGASSKSICGGSYRQSKMSFVFWQFCNGGRLSTFSTESALLGPQARSELSPRSVE